MITLLSQTVKQFHIKTSVYKNRLIHRKRSSSTFHQQC